MLELRREDVMRGTGGKKADGSRDQGQVKVERMHGIFIDKDTKCNVMAEVFEMRGEKEKETERGYGKSRVGTLISQWV